MSDTGLRTVKPSWPLSRPSPEDRLTRVWRLWPYAVLVPVLTIGLFFPDANPFLDTAAVGASVLLAQARPRARGWIVWLALAIGIGLAGRTIGIPGAVRAAGFAAIVVLGFLASHPDAADETRQRSQDAVGICLAIPLIVYALALFRDLHPLTYDPVLARIDAWLPPIAWELSRTLELNAGFRLVCHVSYIVLPLALVLVGELERAHIARRRSIFATAALAAVIGVLAFQVVPGTGPKYAFAGYPGEHPVPGAPALAAPLAASAPRNAMPSLHVTWAMLVAWHAVRIGWLAGALGGLFLILTSLAALATGEHYLVDLVMALPLAIAIGAAVEGHRRTAAVGFLAAAGGLLAIASQVW